MKRIWQKLFGSLPLRCVRSDRSAGVRPSSGAAAPDSSRPVDTSHPWQSSNTNMSECRHSPTLPPSALAPAKGALIKYAAGAMLACGLLLLIGWVALPLVPLQRGLFTHQIPQLEFLDRTGHPLRVVRPDGSPFGRPVEYGEIPQSLMQATLAAEDWRFWHHPGVDWRATTRAAWQWARHRRVVSGGSTITQQLIKLAEPRPRSLRTKLIEAVQALRLERVWDKQRILAAYLNRLDYGNFNRGCAAAADFYFAKPLRDLSPAECALLAALPQAPTRLNPYAHFKQAVKRQQWILGQMRSSGWLTVDQWQRALQEPLRLAPPRRVFEAPHFVDLLLQMDQAQEPPEDARHSPEALVQPQGLGVRQCSGALGAVPISGKAPEHWRTPRRWRDPSPPTLRTTLDLALNRFAETALHQHLSRLKAQHVSDGAIVVLDTQSSEVLALVGSGNYFAPTAGQVNGAWAPRSPGSALKPFTYLLA
ncbi:MAG: transglycosylase domain-containing protein, partial [Verrucomicrobia bacterium]|nr:transglycosylase domain-containing protein [Verrucomicrobiota bacterium]